MALVMSPTPVRQLHGFNQNVEISWCCDGSSSVRAYDAPTTSPEWFCVSTRSTELFFVLRGEAVFRMGPSGQALRFGELDCGLILRGTPHLVEMLPGTRVVVVDAFEPASSWPHFSQKLGIARCAPHSKTSMRHDLLELWQHLLSYDSRQLSSVSCRLMRSARALQVAELQPRHHTQRMVSIKGWLERNRMEELSLHAVAHAASINRFYLARAFKENFGVSPREYLSFLRVESATWSILEPQERCSKTALAVDVGFGDYATFAKGIRKRFGKPPSQLVSAGAI